ncbi:hypothetical protein PF007_g3356 [Phytophthora fragariae]|uniref:HTH CENPB-type domain-containing protein n=4 Tax=Phytophthora TaxID=4783 RepID=A0A6A3TC07_9STRA|nr:hypothetical protein PF007_g3356 [Phytophthora fragariae]
MRAVPHQNERKLEAIERAKGEGVSKDLAKQYNVNRVTLYRWVKNESAIRSAKPSKTYAKNTKRGPPVTFQAMEKQLFEWVKVMRRNKSKCVTTECLMIMAARFEPRFLKDRSPAAATEYLRRFRRRHKLSIRRITHRGTKQRSDLELCVVAASFGHSMRYAFEHDSAVSFVAGDEKYGQVFNMDQTSIYIDMNPTTTITFRGDRNVDVLQGMSENSFRASAAQLRKSYTRTRYTAKRCFLRCRRKDTVTNASCISGSTRCGDRR